MSRHVDVMRLLLNASAALDNARYFIKHRDEFDSLDDVGERAGTQLQMALFSIEELMPLIGEDRGATMIEAELALCHALDAKDDRRTCRLERGHDGDHKTSQDMFEEARRDRWLSGTVYDFERAEADVYLATVP